MEAASESNTEAPKEMNSTVECSESLTQSSGDSAKKMAFNPHLAVAECGSAKKLALTPPTVKKAIAKKSSGKVPKIAGLTLEQHRRALGDMVKSNIHVQKWCIEARTHTKTTMELDVFRELVVPNATKVVPAAFDASTDVVFASSNTPGVICGSSKITGGTRLGSWSADVMDFIYFPKSRELEVWWTMS